MSFGPSVHTSAARNARAREHEPERRAVGGKLRDIGRRHLFGRLGRRPIRLVVEHEQGVVQDREAVDLA